MRKVIGSSPISSTRKKKPHHSVWFFFFLPDDGLEQIESQHAGGMLLPPVQKLVASFILPQRAKCKSSPVSSFPSCSRIWADGQWPPLQGRSVGEALEPPADFPKRVRILRLTPLNCGMLAPGKHIYFIFAARRTTLRMTGKIGIALRFFLSLRGPLGPWQSASPLPRCDLATRYREAQEPPLQGRSVGEGGAPRSESKST